MRHYNTYSYSQARIVMDNEYPLQMEINAMREEGISKIAAFHRIIKAASYMVGYRDADCPPISRRSVDCYARETVADW